MRRNKSAAKFDIIYGEQVAVFKTKIDDFRIRPRETATFRGCMFFWRIVMRLASGIHKSIFKDIYYSMRGRCEHKDHFAYPL